LASPGHLLRQFGVLVITIIGHLYVAVLIALVLGHFNRRPQL
jgi:hypothetical protein